MDKHSFTYRFSLVVAIVVGALSIPTLQSCMPRGTDEASIYTGDSVDLKHVNYQTLSAVILTPRCVKCHSDFSTEQGLSYHLADLYQEVSSGKMPQGGPALSSKLIQMVQIYADQASMPVIDLNHVTFDVLNQAVLKPRCMSCHFHSAGGDFANETAFQRFVEAADPESSVAYNLVMSGEMPRHKTPLSENNKAAMKIYIQSLPAKQYPPIAPTWASLNANLFQRSCVQCHNPRGEAKKEPFDTWAGVTAYDDKILKKLQGADDKPMPPEHTTAQPSQELIDAYVNWYNSGDPQQ